jgi:hypothetical protein
MSLPQPIQSTRELIAQVRGGFTYMHRASNDDFVFCPQAGPEESDLDLLRCAYNSGLGTALRACAAILDADGSEVLAEALRRSVP